MSPKFFCVSVTQSFERTPSKVAHAPPRFIPLIQYIENLQSNLQESAIRMLYIFYLKKKIKIWNMKNKYKGWKRHRPDKDKGVRFVDYMLPKYHYCSGHRFGLHPQFYPLYQFEFYLDLPILPYHQMRRHGACHVLHPIQILNYMFEANSFITNTQTSYNN